MLKKSSKTAFLAASMMALASTGAAADNGKASLNAYVYDVQSAWTTMYVTSSDGTKWDAIEDGTLKFFADMKIDTKWPGAIGTVGVVLGKCPVESCKVLPILWSKSVYARDFDDQTNISVSTSLLSGTTLELSLERQKIIATCNQHRSAFGATNRHEFQHSLSTTFVADTYKKWGRIKYTQAGYETVQHPSYIDHEKSGDFTFNVVCKPYAPPPPVDDQQKQEEEEIKTTDLDLFLSTFSNAATQPNPATTCKKGRVLVRATTTKEGPAKVKLWTKVGGAPITSKVIDAWSSDDGNGGFKAEYTEWISVSEPTPVQAMAEDMVDSIGQSTQWKSIMLQCSGTGGTNTGGGGFTQDSLPTDDPLPTDPTVNPDVPPSTTDLTPNPGRPEDPPGNLQTLTGDFGFVDYGSPKCSRTGKALVTFRSPKSDNIHWSLDCKFSSKSGVLETHPHPDGGYMAATLVPIDVDTTMDESCTLRTVAPYGPKDHVTKAHLFQCVTPTMPPATTDLKPETRPEPQGPHVPGKVVIDPPRLPRAPDRVVTDPQHPSRNPQVGTAVIDPVRSDNGGSGASDATPDYSGKTRADADADKRRLEELRRKRAEAARKKVEAERKRREAANKAAELKRKRDAAKKAADARRKRQAAEKAAEARRKREAAKRKAAQANKKRKAIKRRRSASTAGARVMRLR